MGDPMTEAEARERLVDHVAARIEQTSVTEDACFAVAAILATTDALAVLLDPETMLRAWEEAGRAKRFGSPYARFGWRIVPDEEGARDG